MEKEKERDVRKNKKGNNNEEVHVGRTEHKGEWGPHQSWH